ncbi:MAG: hypothetical protein ACLT98_06020 [Eggerthellaceae bacterium]
MLSDMNPWAWPFELQKDHDDGQARGHVQRHRSGRRNPFCGRSVQRRSCAACERDDPSTMRRPSFVIKPEAVGTALDADAVIKAADEAVADLDRR